MGLTTVMLASQARATRATRCLLLALVLLGAVGWVYAPVTNAGFIWDDNDYVYDNATLETLGGLKDIWFSPRSSPQYYPLVFTSFWVERRLFDLGPSGHHVVNICLHALNALMLWAVLGRLRVRGAYLAALVFAVHPVNVESVAWITERKNVLSGAFYFAAIWTYLKFVRLERGRDVKDPVTGRRSWYVASLLLFVAALFSKTVTVTLPAVLLLVVWWKRARVETGDLLRLVPFLVIGLSAGVGTAWLEVHHVGAAGDHWNLSPVGRLLLATRVPWFYAQKLYWPRPLVFIYPRWEVSASGLYLVFALSTVAILLSLFAYRRHVGRGPFVAAAYFLVTLFPAMGIFNVYPMRYSYVADHFQYLASIGLIVLTLSVCVHVLRRAAGNRGAVGGVAAGLFVVATLAIVARGETRKYEGIETLWHDTLAKNPEAWMAHNNLGTLRLRQQRWDEAEEYFEAALRVNPGTPEANNNLGTALYAQGKISEATAQYRTAVTVDPKNAGAWNNLGIALAAAGAHTDAVQAFRSSLALAPNDAATHYNLGKALHRMQMLARASVELREALRLDPNLAMAHYELGLTLLEQNQADSSVHLSRAFELIPGFAEGYVQVANMQLKQGLATEAVSNYTAAIGVKPDYVEAFCNRGTAHLILGRMEEAERDYLEALRLRPGYKPAEAGLASIRDPTVRVKDHTDHNSGSSGL